MYRQKIADLIEQRNRCITQGREILDKADKEKRSLSAEERANYDKAFADGATLKADIERYEGMEAEERATAERETRSQREQATGGNAKTKEELQMAGFRSWMRGETRANAEGAAEFRDLQANTNASGGYLVVPEVYAKDVLTKKKDLLFLRQKATVIPMPTAASLGIPTLETDPADADWTSEIAIGGTDATMAFGKRKLEPHALGKLIKVSRELLRMSALNPEGIVRDRFAYKFGVSEEKGFLTGNGSQQPLGLFTASANGISTGRDVVTGSATDLTFDGIYNAKYSIKAQYRANAEWLVSRTYVNKASLLKDSYGRYLWQPSQQLGTPDMLIGHAVNESEYVPSTFTSGLYVGIFGDLSYYWIADAYDMEVQRLEELYAATNQVGFIMREKTDGMPVLEEAFARQKTS